MPTPEPAAWTWTGNDLGSVPPNFAPSYSAAALTFNAPLEPEYVDDVLDDDQYMLEDPDDALGPVWGVLDATRLGEFQPESEIDFVIDD